MKKKKITVVDYNPKWAIQFENLRYVLNEKLGDIILNIEHVGSTSVPGLKAKPIIDIDIVIEDPRNSLDQVVFRLNELGYNHLGDLGVSGREAFRGIDQTIPKTESKRNWPRHNLYVCTNGCMALNNHIMLRDYLREHPEAVVKYGNLKTRLSEKYPYDIDAYISGKTNFIVSSLRKMGMKEHEIKVIRKINDEKE